MSYDLDDVAPSLAPFQRFVSGSKGQHPATIASKKQRARGLDAMGRKSRKTAARSKFAEHQAEQDYRGMARVHLLKMGTPAMQDNVRAAIYKMAYQEAGGHGVDFSGPKFNEALASIESMLRAVAVAYGDMD